MIGIQPLLIGEPGREQLRRNNVRYGRVSFLELQRHSDGALHKIERFAVAPIRDQQPVVAGQVVDAGAGIRVHFGRVGATELRHAIMSVLDDPSYRTAARRVQSSFAAAGGAPTAADHLEKLT